MNEKIRELLEQSTTIVGDEHCHPSGRIAVDQEKFAELIVRECSQMAHNSYPSELPFVGGKMLTYFGIE